MSSQQGWPAASQRGAVEAGGSQGRVTGGFWVCSFSEASGQACLPAEKK